METITALSIATVEKLRELRVAAELMSEAHSKVCAAQAYSKIRGHRPAVDLAALTWSEAQASHRRFREAFKTARAALDDIGAELLHRAVWGKQGEKQ